MKLTVKRFEYGTDYTVGRLYIDDVYYCFTLEDKVRQVDDRPVSEWKVQGHTAIPRGTYDVSINYSEHFGRDMPLLNGVEDYEGVRIHPGNTDKDTEGCILLGQLWNGTDYIGNSKLAFDPFFEKLQADGSATITVE